MQKIHIWAVLHLGGGPQTHQDILLDGKEEAKPQWMHIELVCLTLMIFNYFRRGVIADSGDQEKKKRHWRVLFGDAADACDESCLRYVQLYCQLLSQRIFKFPLELFTSMGGDPSPLEIPGVWRGSRKTACRRQLFLAAKCEACEITKAWPYCWWKKNDFRLASQYQSNNHLTKCAVFLYNIGG